MSSSATISAGDLAPPVLASASLSCWLALRVRSSRASVFVIAASDAVDLPRQRLLILLVNTFLIFVEGDLRDLAGQLACR